MQSTKQKETPLERCLGKLLQAVFFNRMSVTRNVISHGVKLRVSLPRKWMFTTGRTWAAKSDVIVCLNIRFIQETDKYNTKGKLERQQACSLGSDALVKY